MNPELTEAGYIQTKAKLADLMERRSRIAVWSKVSKVQIARPSLSVSI